MSPGGNGCVWEPGSRCTSPSQTVSRERLDLPLCGILPMPIYSTRTFSCTLALLAVVSVGVLSCSAFG